jgi:hypothetical protein
MSATELIQAIGALVVALGGLTFAYQRYSAIRSKDRTERANDVASVSQFKSLQDAIEYNRLEAAEARKETAALRLEFSRMDKTIHNQQRTITRMEMLIRQFTSLVEQHGIQVPIYMTSELRDLIVPGDEITDRRVAKDDDAFIHF